MFGGIHLNFCYNCIFQGIVWDGCGNNSIHYHIEPGLKLSNSSNITINNCSFQYSKGPAVLLSEVSGDMNINHCNFVHNNYYRGHGAAIHYSSSIGTRSHNKLPVLTINDCNFAYNYAKSLVHFENTVSTEHYNNITFRSAKFSHNEGISVYAANQNIHLNEKNVFQNNTAENGTGIYISDCSTVIFGENSSTTFIKSFVHSSGGVMLLKNYSSIIFDQNSVTTFNANEAATNGGAIYAKDSSNVTFKTTSKVMFNNNFAKQYGGAIYSSKNSCINFEGNSTALFSNNSADSEGGAMFVRSSFIFFEGKSTTMFNNNTASKGGAICSRYKSYMVFEGNSTAEFNYNAATFTGGAIYSVIGKMSFEGFSVITFDHNIAAHGGAVATLFE